ncbi:MAG: DUF2752 domain-containing protein [Eubacterium sp.]|nr:DUF2752 domain-containing protein [Eubacterium sp.]
MGSRENLSSNQSYQDTVCLNQPSDQSWDDKLAVDNNGTVINNNKLDLDVNGQVVNNRQAEDNIRQPRLKPTDKKSVACRMLMDILIIIGCGIVYYFVVVYTKMGFRCYFHDIFGLQCPACGMTRMFLSASRLDLKEAFHYNMFMFVSFPIVVGEIIYLFYLNESRKKMNRINKIFMTVWIALFVVWGIIRNILSI